MASSSFRNMYTQRNVKRNPPGAYVKCHGWGHLSYVCKQPFDTCGTCAGRHRMASCREGHRPRCVSCRVEGHVSWDRACPVFIRKCDELSERLTENHMPFFPTNEPWTQVSQPPRPPRQGIQHPNSGGGFSQEPRRTGPQQTTLRFTRIHRHGQAGGPRTDCIGPPRPGLTQSSRKRNRGRLAPPPPSTQ